MISTQIIVVGGGCVGLTAAIGLANKGLQVCLIDGGGDKTELTEPELRVSALSKASENTLTNVGAWQQLQKERITPYKTMKVWDKHSFGKIQFAATDVGFSELGHIVENNNLRNALLDIAKDNSNIQLLLNQRVQDIHNDEQQVAVTLESNKIVIGQLLVAADGANSFVRKQQNMDITFSDYDHHAMVATVNTELPHNNCARQVFLPTGPLALLPLWNTNQCSIVWSSTPEHNQQVSAMSADEFNKAITAATDCELGVLSLDSERPVFPLTMRYANTWIKQRVVLMGDAAHTIHPLAGLGMNLGLLDAASLVELMDNESLSDKQTLDTNLEKYQGWRKSQAQVYIATMAGLKELFAGDNPVKKLIRGIGLTVTNNTPLVKNKFVEQAVGLTDDLPELAAFTDPL